MTQVQATGTATDGAKPWSDGEYRIIKKILGEDITY